MKKEKSELRKKMLSLRDGIPAADRVKMSRAAEELLFGFEPFIRARTVMFFVSFRSEINTEGMIRRALSAGKRIVVPVTILEEKTLFPCEIKDYDRDLAEGAYGILEPREDVRRPTGPEEMDFVALPGAAFDRGGNRIGYGGGFYDRFLMELRPDAVLAAFAFSEQIISRVPVSRHDRKVHYIITDKEIIDCRSRAGGKN